MIDDLDKTLEELLKRELPSPLAGQVTITFATPDHDFPPSSVALPAVDLFLYDVRENHELRSNEWTIDRRGDGVTRRLPPARVDCSYLITAWPSPGQPSPIQDEHRLLGAVMQVLLRHATIPAAVLQGSLADQDLPLPTSALQTGQLQSMAEFWQALGGRPRAALNYTVTIGVDAGVPEEVGPPATGTLLKLGRTEG
jgi:hypothetical protein